MMSTSRYKKVKYQLKDTGVQFHSQTYINHMSIYEIHLNELL